MNDTEETMAFLQRAGAGPLIWKAKCLMLARKARDIPAFYPSAITAQIATPIKHRITDLSKVKRGMVMYYDDPKDSNPFGHIVTVAGRTSDGEIVVWSNDILRTGGVNKVPANIFPAKWGDDFQFASDWLNGQVLDLPDTKPKPALVLSKDKRIKRAIESLEALRDENKGAHPRVVKALNRDLKELKETYNKFVEAKK